MGEVLGAMAYLAPPLSRILRSCAPQDQVLKGKDFVIKLKTAKPVGFLTSKFFAVLAFLKPVQPTTLKRAR